jgi:hypothetical protein
VVPWQVLCELVEGVLQPKVAALRLLRALVVVGLLLKAAVLRLLVVVGGAATEGGAVASAVRAGDGGGLLLKAAVLRLKVVVLRLLRTLVGWWWGGGGLLKVVPWQVLRALVVGGLQPKVAVLRLLRVVVVGAVVMVVEAATTKAAFRTPSTHEQVKYFVDPCCFSYRVVFVVVRRYQQDNYCGHTATPTFCAHAPIGRREVLPRGFHIAEFSGTLHCPCRCQQAGRPSCSSPKECGRSWVGSSWSPVEKEVGSPWNSGV